MVEPSVVRVFGPALQSFSRKEVIEGQVHRDASYPELAEVVDIEVSESRTEALLGFQRSLGGAS